MTSVTWEESTAACTALWDGKAVCLIKVKDIGGCTANWLDNRKWAPPAHLPKAIAQDSQFFADKDAAKSAVEKVLMAGTS